jgi:hypothetical protein
MRCPAVSPMYRPRLVGSRCRPTVGSQLPFRGAWPEDQIRNSQLALHDRWIARSRPEELIDDMDYAICRQHVGELQSDAIHTHAVCAIRDK